MATPLSLYYSLRLVAYSQAHVQDGLTSATQSPTSRLFLLKTKLRSRETPRVELSSGSRIVDAHSEPNIFYFNIGLSFM